MAWEHFTDWMQPGEIITKAKRDELIDAFDERCRFVRQFELLDRPDDNVVSSTIRFVNPITPSVNTTMLSVAIRYLGSFFAYDPFITDGLFGLGGNPNPLHQAMDELGYGSGNYPSMFNAAGVPVPPINSHLYWNICRRALQLLKYPQIAFPVEASRDSKQAARAGFSGTLNALSSASYASETFGRNDSEGRWQNNDDQPALASFARVERLNYEASIEEMTDFDLFVWVQTRSTSQAISGESDYTVKIDGQGVEQSNLIPAYPADPDKVPFLFIGSGGRAITNASEEITMQLEPSSAHDASAWAGKPAGEEKWCRARITRAFAEPDFAHPYEEIDPPES